MRLLTALHSLLLFANAPSIFAHRDINHRSDLYVLDSDLDTDPAYGDAYPMNTNDDDYVDQHSYDEIYPRSGRTCLACKKLKLKCEGDPPCKRCAANSIECVFEATNRRGRSG